MAAGALVAAGSDAAGPVADVLSRIELVGCGVVHMLVAWLSLQVAIVLPDVAADARGAVAQSPTLAVRGGASLDE
jgi:hypothetical protein